MALTDNSMAFLRAGLEGDSASAKSGACEILTYLLDKSDANDGSIVQLVVSNDIYPLLFDCITNSDDVTANKAIDTIKALARFPDAMSVIFPAEADDATDLCKLAANSSPLVRVRLLILIAKLSWVSPHIGLEIKRLRIRDLLRAETRRDTEHTFVVILKGVKVFYDIGPHSLVDQRENTVTEQFGHLRLNSPNSDAKSD